MKKNYYKSLALLLGLPAIMHAQQPEWNWVKSAQNNAGCGIQSLAKDQSGNLYSGGLFDGAMSFDSHTVVNNQMGANFFIAKHDASGAAQWINKGEGMQAYLYDLAADAEGNTYGVGYFFRFLRLGEILLESDATWCMVLFRMDSNGNYTWARKFGDSHRVTAKKITTDAEGNLYVAGSFSCPEVRFDEVTLTRAGGQDAFVTKFDSHGNVIWAKSAGITGLSSADALTVDADGNVYTGGTFGGSLAFGSNTFTSTGSYDFYLTKYDMNGNVAWSKAMGGSDFEAPDNLVVDAGGNIIMTGEYYSPTLEIGGITLSNAGGNDIFLSKFNPQGDAIWTKGISGNLSDGTGGITIDADSKVYISGQFNSESITIDGTTLQNQTSGSSLFIASFNPSGNLRWTEQVSGNGSASAADIVMDSNANMYIAGRYNNNMNFGDIAVSTGVNGVAFVAKFAAGTLGTPDHPAMGLSLYPNPASDTLYLDAAFNNSSYTIYDVTGKNIQAGYITNNGIGLSALAKGLYILSLEDGVTAKFIKE